MIEEFWPNSLLLKYMQDRLTKNKVTMEDVINNIRYNTSEEYSIPLEVKERYDITVDYVKQMGEAKLCNYIANNYPA